MMSEIDAKGWAGTRSNSSKDERVSQYMDVGMIIGDRILRWIWTLYILYVYDLCTLVECQRQNLLCKHRD